MGPGGRVGQAETTVEVVVTPMVVVSPATVVVTPSRNWVLVVVTSGPRVCVVVTSTEMVWVAQTMASAEYGLPPVKSTQVGSK